MIAIKKENRLILTYETQMGDYQWIYNALDEHDEFYLKSTFFFQKSDVCSNPDENDVPVKFFLSEEKSEQYYKIPKRILDIDFDLYIHESISLSKKTFITETNNVSILRCLNKFNIQSLYIGGNNRAALSEETFEEIIKSIPTQHERTLYIRARIDAVLRNFFQTNANSEEKFKKYVNKKISLEGKKISSEFREYEISKYEIILNKMTKMLSEEEKYSEKQWQKEILEIILLLYPKYIRAFESTLVKDPYANTNRELDFLLVDAGGNIDIIEIKKPFNNAIITKSQYRDNYIPLRELSGTIMQIEKYLFLLKSWGIKGEGYLTERYTDSLPSGFQVRITNPSGMIIMGREEGLNTEQLRDFEVVKRKYKNIVDIITYDDLIRRLHFIVSQLKRVEAA